MLFPATNRLVWSRWVKSPASVRIVAQHAPVAVPRSRPHLCGGVIILCYRYGTPYPRRRMLLAAVGTYGVMSYLVGQRTNEIGIRMALGARPMEILAMVLRQAFLLVMIGTVVGWGGAAGGAKAMESMLFHVPPFDPVTYASVSGLLAMVALAACWIPVRRAMRVDPMVALRDE